MERLSTEAYGERDEESLYKFLKYCQAAAVKKGCFQIASISLEVKYMDPLAVLESIYEREALHFYMEHPLTEEAIAGAESVVEGSFEGPERFQKAKTFARDVLENMICIGDLGMPFSGPHFFASFTFFDVSEPEEAFFCPGKVFLPRWQVSNYGGVYGAVANVKVEAGSDLGILAKKIWAAHLKFNAFDYKRIGLAEDRDVESIKRIPVGGLDWYKEAVEAGVRGIRQGRYEKIVLARALDLKKERGFDALGSLNRLRTQFPECFACSVGNERGQSFIAAAPERLLKVSSGKLLTEALAGSAPRGKHVQEDAFYGQGLLSSEKDLREHQVVIDSIVRHLKALGISYNISKRPKLRKLANVQHLLSLIEAELPEGVNLLDVVERLHPTPAVGGSPLGAATKDIASIENFERGLYAGTVGWFDHQGDGEFVVAIRSALIDKRKARLYAGCGIVEGSDPGQEHEETEIKFEAILNNLE